MKRTAALLVCCIILCSSIYAANVAVPTSDFYVNDYARVLSPATKKHIMEISPDLASKTGAQVVVLTVESLDGMSISEYGLEAGRSWGIGGSDENNGVLILLSTGDREIRLEVGYGLEGAINDAKAGRIIDQYAKDYYAQDDFDTGTYELYNAVASEVYAEYGLERISGYEAGLVDDKLNLTGRETALVIGIAIVFGIIVLSVMYSIVMTVFRFILAPFGVNIPRRKNHVLSFLYLLLTLFLSGRGGGGRGGGFGGGGFGGGGGSFGGGGASRRF